MFSCLFQFLFSFLGSLGILLLISLALQAAHPVIRTANKSLGISKNCLGKSKQIVIVLLLFSLQVQSEFDFALY